MLCAGCRAAEVHVPHRRRHEAFDPIRRHLDDPSCSHLRSLITSVVSVFEDMQNEQLSILEDYMTQMTDKLLGAVALLASNVGPTTRRSRARSSDSRPPSRPRRRRTTRRSARRSTPSAPPARRSPARPRRSSTRCRRRSPRRLPLPSRIRLRPRRPPSLPSPTAPTPRRTSSNFLRNGGRYPGPFLPICQAGRAQGPLA
jgi:hypothetical protein